MAFREKWLSADTARKTSLENSLVAKSGFSRKVAFREKYLFGDTVRATTREKSLFRKVAFREKWLFADTARATSREKSLFAKSGFSRKVAFRGRRARQRGEKTHFSQKSGFSIKVAFRQKWLFAVTARATSREKSLFEKSGFSRKVAFREKWLFGSIFPVTSKTPHTPAQGQEAQEGGCFGAKAPTHFQGQLRPGDTAGHGGASGYVPCRLRRAAAVMERPGSTSARVGLARTCERGDERGDNRELRAVPEGQAVGCACRLRKRRAYPNSWGASGRDRRHRSRMRNCAFGMACLKHSRRASSCRPARPRRDGTAPGSDSGPARAAPSPASRGWTGSWRRVCAWARMAASAARAVQRRVKARAVATCGQGARVRPRTRARRRRNASVLVLKRPPTSRPKTTRRHRPRPPSCSSGYVRCLRRAACSSASPGRASAPGLACPSRRTGLTNVVSTAICAPCHRGRPLATTSILRPSVAGASRLRSRRAMLVATRAPASRQMRAAARSRGPALCASTPT